MSTQPITQAHTPRLLIKIRELVTSMRIYGMTMENAKFALEREFIISAMVEYHGNACHAAKALGVHRNTLHRDFHRLSIDAALLRQLCKKGAASK